MILGRPLKFDRENAVEKAMQAFWAHGYEANSTKALAAHLGITRSSFYNSFGSREALFSECADVYCIQSPDYAFALAKKGVVIKPLLTSVFRAACKARAGDRDARGCLLVNGVSELCNNNDELGTLIESMVLGCVDRIEELLNWGREQGEFNQSDDLHIMAVALQSQLMGLNVICKVVRDESELWAATKLSLVALGIYEEPKDLSANLN